MNCSEIQNILSSFIDGELDSTESAAVKAHLMRCASCRSERDKLEKIGAALRSLEPLTAPPDFEFKLFAGIRNRESKRRMGTVFSWKYIAVPFAAMVVGIFIGASFLQDTRVPVASTDAKPDSIAEIISDSPIVTEEDGLKEYKIDSYPPRIMNPVTVRTIPDDLNTENQGFRENPLSSGSRRYMPDRAPRQASYERTIY